MPKMKTNKSAAKRFRTTGGGRIRRSKAGGNHKLSGKSRKRLRRLKFGDVVSAHLEKRVRAMLPYG